MTKYATRDVRDPLLGDISEFQGNKIQEKDVVLNIAGYANEHLKSQKAQVFQTRYSDRDISEEERARIAIDNDADIVVSIHTGHWNASMPVKTDVVPTLAIMVLDNSGSMKANVVRGDSSTPRRRDLMQAYLENFFGYGKQSSLNKSLLNDNIYVGMAKFSSSKNPKSTGLECVEEVVQMSPDRTSDIKKFYTDNVQSFLDYEGLTTLLYRTVKELLDRVHGNNNIIQKLLDSANKKIKADGGNPIQKVSIFLISDGESDATVPNERVSEIDFKEDLVAKGVGDLHIDIVDYKNRVFNQLSETKGAGFTNAESLSMIMIDADEKDLQSRDLEKIWEIDPTFFNKPEYTGSLKDVEGKDLEVFITRAIVESVMESNIPYGVGAFYKRYNGNKTLSQMIMADLGFNTYPYFWNNKTHYYVLADNGRTVIKNPIFKDPNFEDENFENGSLSLEFGKEAILNLLGTGHEANYKIRGITNVDNLELVKTTEDDTELEGNLVQRLGMPSDPRVAKSEYDELGGQAEDLKNVIGNFRTELNQFNAFRNEQEPGTEKYNEYDKQVKFYSSEIRRKNRDKAALIARQDEINKKFVVSNRKYSDLESALALFNREMKKTKADLSVEAESYRQNTYVSLLDLIDTKNGKDKAVHTAQIVVGFLHEKGNEGEAWDAAYQESDKLSSSDYQRIVGESISNGIIDFIKGYLGRNDTQNIRVCLDPGHGKDSELGSLAKERKLIAYYKVYRSEQDIYGDGTRGPESSYEYVGDSERYSASNGTAAPRKYVDMNIERGKIYRYRVQPVMADEKSSRGGAEEEVGFLSRDFGVAITKDVYRDNFLIDQVPGGSRDMANFKPRIVMEELPSPVVDIGTLNSEGGFSFTFRVVNAKVLKTPDIKVLCFFSDDDGEGDAEKKTEEAFLKNVRTDYLSDGRYRVTISSSGTDLKKINFQIVVKGKVVNEQESAGNDLVLVYPDKGEI